MNLHRSLCGALAMMLGGGASTAAQDTMAMTMPSTTYLDRIFLFGAQDSTPPSVQVAGASMPVRRVSAGRWCADAIVAQPGVSALVTATGDGLTASRAVTWTAIDLRAPAVASLDTGVGARVALVADSIALADGPDGAMPIPPAIDGVVTVALTQGGTYRFTGPGGAQLTVRVFAVTTEPDPATPLALRTGWPGSNLGPVSALPIVPDPGAVTVTADGVQVSRLANGTLALQSGTPGPKELLLRVGGANGPVVASVPVIFFDLRVGTPVQVMPDGAPLPVGEPGSLVIYGAPTDHTRYRLPVTITPAVPNVRVTLEKFAHDGYFAGGATTVTVSSNGSLSSVGEPGFAPIDGALIHPLSLWIPPGKAMTTCLQTRVITTIRGWSVSEAVPAGVASLHQGRKAEVLP